jgi:signal peptidase I
MNFGPTERRRRSKSRARKKNANPQARLPWDLRILFAVIVLAVLAQVGWIASGGSLYRIDSASMCPEVCVGSLVLDRPYTASTTLHKGETVTFIPPGLTVKYTHRVVKVFANGTFQTKGDAANIIDPWIVSPADVKGVTAATVWGLGWLSSSLPFLAVGMALILLFRRSIDVRVRQAFDRLLAVLLLIVPIWLIKPLIRATVVQTTSLKHGLERLAIVNTGLLPSQFRATGGQFKDFVASGQRINLTGPLQPDGQVAIAQFVSFHWLGWTIVALVIASPLLLYLMQLPRQRRLSAQYASATLAERLAAQYPEEVLAAAFARVSGFSGTAPAQHQVPLSPPRVPEPWVPSVMGASLAQPARAVDPDVSVAQVADESSKKDKKKKKKKKKKKAKQKELKKRGDEGSP